MKPLALIAALSLALLCAADTPAEVPAEVPSEAPGTRFAPTRDAALLLITSASLQEAWVPFAEWKTQQGKATALITIDEITEHYKAESVREAIRLCVRDHIENRGTRWVLLGGDSVGDGGLVPGGHTTFHAQEPQGIPTDIVYLSPTDWDADGDGVHGEWGEDDDAITYPDGSVGLGRVPVRTSADVEAYTQKVIAYESAYPEGAFATTMVYTCTDTPAYPKVRASWDRHVSRAWAGEAHRYFNTETPWDEEGAPGSHDLSDQNFVGLINERSAGKLHVHGHGLLDRWILERSAFMADDVHHLKNAGAYPLITTVSCNTGEYDSPRDPSIVELMLRTPDAGSVAIVAPVRTGKPHFHKRSDFRLMVTEGKLDGTTMTMTRYWELGLGESLTTGEALMRSKSTLAGDAATSPNYHLCLCEINLLGDPTLPMRPEPARTPTLEVPARLTPGVREFTVSTDAPGATVCVWLAGDVYEVVQADGSGDARLTVEAESTGDMLVTVSGPSLNTVTRAIRVAHW